MHVKASGGITSEKSFLSTVPAGTKVDLFAKAALVKHGSHANRL